MSSMEFSLPPFYKFFPYVLLILKYFRNETEELKRKLENLEKKILVGGENLLEKVETQEQLLEMAAKELEERKTREDHLSEQIKQKEVGVSNLKKFFHFHFTYVRVAFLV